MMKMTWKQNLQTKLIMCYMLNTFTYFYAFRMKKQTFYK